MPARKILCWPDPRLQKTATTIESIDDQAVELARDLIDSMKVEFGAGLAASQINVHRSMVVIAAHYAADYTLDVDPLCPEAIVLVNPKLIDQSEETFYWEEACLSVPNYSELVERHTNIKLEYQNLSGDSIVCNLSSPFSGIVQHEVDHLSGKLYLDRLSPDKKRGAIIALREQIAKRKKATRKKINLERRSEWADSIKKGFRAPSLRGNGSRKKARKNKK